VAHCRNKLALRKKLRNLHAKSSGRGTLLNLRRVRSSGIFMPSLNSLALIVSEIQRSSGQTDMAISTRLVILIKNIYTLRGRKRFLLPVTYFPTNLVYPFTLRVTGIQISGVELTANISLLYLYRPNGVMKVVMLRLDSSSFN